MAVDLKGAQQTLQQSLLILPEALNPKILLRKMTGRGALSADEVTRINIGDTDTDKVTKLIETLMRKPLSSYEVFMELLQQERPDLYTDVKEKVKLVQGLTIYKSNEFGDKEFLRRGGFGSIYLMNHNVLGRVVIKAFESDISAEDIYKEANKMQRVINCPYLVRIMGFIDEHEKKIVMQYYTDGNLRDFNRKLLMRCECWPRKITMVHEMCMGMNYLHTLKPAYIIHADLKLLNVFVEGLHVKIGDFGLAASSTSKLDSGQRGTITHISPETLTGKVKPDRLCDVFAFGITLYEFVSGEDPYKAYGDSHSYTIGRKVEDGERPDLDAIPSNAIPSKVRQQIIDLMKKCWDGERNNRPQFQEIKKSVETMLTPDREVQQADIKITTMKYNKRASVMLDASFDTDSGIEYKHRSSEGSNMRDNSSARDQPYQDSGTFSGKEVWTKGATAKTQTTEINTPDSPEKPKTEIIDNTKLKITWLPPRNDNGSPVSRYIVEQWDAKCGKWSVIISKRTSTEHTLRNVEAGTKHQFRVIAQNVRGASEPSEPSEPITIESPVQFHLDEPKSGKVTAFGPGLTHGICGEPCEFTINTKEGGAGGLTIAIDGPSKAKINRVDNKDGTCSVTYFPTAQGEYDIVVKFADMDILDSPFKAQIVSATVSVDQEPVHSELSECDIGEWEKGEWAITEKLGNPRGITLNSNGDVAVANGQSRVNIYSANGDYRFNLNTTEGLHLDQMSFPRGVVYTKGTYFVSDQTSHVKCYDASDGQLSDSWLSEAPSDRAGYINKRAKLSGICLDSVGNNILVGETSNKYISKHESDGTHLLSFNVGVEPHYLAITSGNNIVISGGSKVQIVDQQGTGLHSIQYPGMKVPCGVCCHSDIVFVSDCKQSNIYCLGLSGNFICSIPTASACYGLVVHGNGKKIFATTKDNKVVMYERK
ncbi:uncharacterized protein [Amphiura filiformis]|uniref:uncharacterized protein n=1 Tax=Amphiura filiformis TaxID=82378 RepID=UPI003B224223